MAFFFFVVFSSLPTVMGSTVDHCLQHDHQGEMIQITCEFNNGAFNGGQCPINRANPYFDIPVKGSEFSVICNLTSTERSQQRTRHGAGVCWCNGTLSRSSSCTLLLNTTYLGKRQVTWKGCSEIQIQLEAKNISNTYPSIVDETTTDNVKASEGVGILVLVTFSLLGLLWCIYRNLEEDENPLAKLKRTCQRMKT